MIFVNIDVNVLFARESLKTVSTGTIESVTNFRERPEGLLAFDNFDGGR